MISREQAIHIAIDWVAGKEFSPHKFSVARYLQRTEDFGPRWAVEFAFLDEEFRDIPLLIIVDAETGHARHLPSL